MRFSLVVGYGELFAAILGLSALFFWLLDSVLGGLDFISSSAATSRLVEIIRERNLSGAKFYDLGSARGKFAVRLARELSELKISGIDDNWFRTLFAKCRSVFLKNTFFKKGDILKADVSAAEIVYLYLPQEQMPDLQSKLQKELKLGAVVITNGVSFPDWHPSEIFITHAQKPEFEKLYLYVKN